MGDHVDSDMLQSLWWLMTTDRIMDTNIMKASIKLSDEFIDFEEYILDNRSGQ